MTSSPFGRVLTAMVTPMTADGEVDPAGTDALVDHLLATGHDGIVVNGTTGEASTAPTRCCSSAPTTTSPPSPG